MHSKKSDYKMVSPINNLSPKKQTITPDPGQHKKQLNELKKNQTEINKIKKDTEKTVSQINQTMENAFGKAAKQITLLRLDMLADKLDKINPRWANRMDLITNKLEKDWE